MPKTTIIFDVAYHCLLKFHGFKCEYDVGGNLIQETVWVGDPPVATLCPNGAGTSLYYGNPTELGCPRVLRHPNI